MLFAAKVRSVHPGARRRSECHTPSIPLPLPVIPGSSHQPDLPQLGASPPRPSEALSKNGA